MVLAQAPRNGTKRLEHVGDSDPFLTGGELWDGRVTSEMRKRFLKK